MRDPVERGMRAVANWDSYALVCLQFGIAQIAFAGGLGLLALYQPMSLDTFLLLFVISEAVVAIDNVFSIKLTRRISRPVSGDDVLITDATRALLSASSFELEERPPVPLKGKREEVRLWAVSGPVPVAASSGRNQPREDQRV